MSLWETISGEISRASAAPFVMSEQQSVGGGCINSAYRIGDGRRRFFVKLNTPDGLEMFEAEADGLRELGAAGAVKVPVPLVTGIAAGQAFIVMEALELVGSGSAARLGQELAALHRTTRPRFGWHRDNTIGSTPQYNSEKASWVTFWREQRLMPQLEMAMRRGAGGALQKQGERLLVELHAFFDSYSPPPSLLHGDLWAGNYAYCSMSGDGRYSGSSGGSEPVIFDPAVYYGDREADLAMTELFGGFGRDFYAAYNEACPLDEGYAVRKTLYNLYHILNHYNLFGGGYAGQAETMIGRLLAEVGG